jgi:hypothetical protein
MEKSFKCRGEKCLDSCCGVFEGFPINCCQLRHVHFRT